MRLPFPERIPLLYVFCFASLLSVAQVLEGTPAPFTLCSFLFIIIAGFTFNLAGGFTRPSGSYIFFYAVLGAIVGLFWKAVLGEPADSNLSVPQVTIEVYLGGICSMLIATYFSRKLTTKRALLGTILEESKMQNATIGCMIAGIISTVLVLFIPHTEGSVLSALQQVDRFLPMAIIIGVTYQIRKSGGMNSVDLPVLVSFAFIFLTGVVGFSKQGMIMPFFCWLVAACSMRYRISLIQIGGGILATVFIFQFLVPYSQYGRSYMTQSIFENFDTAVGMLSNLGYVRKQFISEERDEPEAINFYNTPQGFFDRLQMVAMDDALINVTEQGHVYGLTPIWAGFENLVPHFLWPGKPRLYYGTEFAHEIGGIVPDNDTTTGISFTPTAEAFHLDRWTGIFVIAPILWTMLFTLFDSLCGDVRKAPWGLLVIPLFAHAAPEAGLDGVIYLLGYGAISIIFAAMAAAYVTPLLGTLVAGPENISLRRIARVRSIPSRANVTRSSEG